MRQARASTRIGAQSVKKRGPQQDERSVEGVVVTEVTAAIVAYNGERYYAQAIESLLNQSHRIAELILVVDRASTDRTVAIAHEYHERDARVRVIEVEHCSIAAKFARVVTEATTEWIAFLDSDDVALPHRVERGLAAALERPDVVAWFGWTWHITPEGRRFRMARHGPTDEQQYAALRRNHEIPIFDHCTGLFRRDALLAAGNYDPAISIAPDYDIVDRLTDVGVMLTIPEPLAEYRLHGANMSRQNYALQTKQATYLWERRAATDKGDPFPSFEEYAARPPSGSRTERLFWATRQRSRFYWDATGTQLACGHPIQAFLSAVRSILWNPRSVVKRLWRTFLYPLLRQRRLRRASA